MCVMLFGVGKLQMRLTNRAAVFAEQSRDVYCQFYLSLSNRQHFECSCCVAVANYLAASTDRTDNFVGVNRTVKDRFALKKHCVCVAPNGLQTYDTKYLWT